MVQTLRGRRAAPLLHFVCLLWAIFALLQNLGYPLESRKEHEHTYGGQWKHLTFINQDIQIPVVVFLGGSTFSHWFLVTLAICKAISWRYKQVLQTILYLLCFITDVVALCIPSIARDVSSVVIPIRDYLFSAFVFPVGLFVAVTFWSLYAYNRELVYPKNLDNINPKWLNHSMHTTILPLLFIELVICAHKYPCWKKGLYGLTFFTVIYITWVHWVHYAAGIWTYPILGVLNISGKIIFFSISYCLLVIFYFLGRYLTSWLWARLRKRWTRWKTWKGHRIIKSPSAREDNATFIRTKAFPYLALNL